MAYPACCHLLCVLAVAGSLESISIGHALLQSLRLRIDLSMNGRFISISKLARKRPERNGEIIVIFTKRVAFRSSASSESFRAYLITVNLSQPSYQIIQMENAIKVI